MKVLLRALVILLVGMAVALAFLPLGSTSWADSIRSRRGGRGRPPGANFERSATSPEASNQSAAAGPIANAPRGRDGQPPPGGRGGRGGAPGLFSHFNGRQSLAGDALRFAQIVVFQIGIPAGLTLAVLAYARRSRRSENMQSRVRS